jgi:succinate-semialdehyde dehydrogenase/glutarate-semialdehyde dehydrogenase
METYLMLIDGQWVDSDSGKYIEVIDPATEGAFARVPAATREEVTRALDAAKRAFPQWSRLSPEQRAAYLWRASRILEERKEQVGRVLTQEQGKPLK